MYGPTRQIHAIHRNRRMVLALEAFNFGLNGTSTERCLSQLISSRVYTDTARRIVCKGYTVLHRTLPNGHCLVRISTKSKGTLTTQVPKSVDAKFRMKMSVMRRRCLLETAKHINRFPTKPAAEMIGKHMSWMMARRSNSSVEVLAFANEGAAVIFGLGERLMSEPMLQQLEIWKACFDKDFQWFCEDQFNFAQFFCSPLVSSEWLDGNWASYSYLNYLWTDVKINVRQNICDKIERLSIAIHSCSCISFKSVVSELVTTKIKCFWRDSLFFVNW